MQCCARCWLCKLGLKCCLVQLIQVESGKWLPNAPVLLATATEAEKGLKILQSHKVRIFKDSFLPISDVNPTQTARILK